MSCMYGSQILLDKPPVRDYNEFVVERKKKRQKPVCDRA